MSDYLYATAVFESFHIVVINGFVRLSSAFIRLHDTSSLFTSADVNMTRDRKLDEWMRPSY